MPFISSSYLPFFSFVSLFAYLRLSTCAITLDKVSFDQNYYNTWGFYHFSSINNGTEVRLSIDEYSGLYSSHTCNFYVYITLWSTDLCSSFIITSKSYIHSCSWTDLGSGFMSNHTYGSGFFRMRMKIPNKDSLGIITTFYVKILIFLFISKRILRALFSNCF